ncbi:MAG: FABP family protein [Promicromonosporaceae bacterium]|nr:FABP family protein [Promicromonosporaceae bacterium]
MVFEFPADLAPEVYPLAWLVGRWHGTGELNHPAVGRRPVTSEIVFDHDGGPYLRFVSTLRTVEEAGPDGPTLENVFSTETGYWRISPDRPEGLPEGTHALEVLLADASGRLSLFLGWVGNGRVDLATDFVARTATSAEVTAAKRVYGLVEGRLMWAEDLAAFGEPMRTFSSAELDRLGGDGQDGEA